MKPARFFRKLLAAALAAALVTPSCQAASNPTAAPREGVVLGQTRIVLGVLPAEQSISSRRTLQTVLSLGAQHRELLSPAARRNFDGLIARSDLAQLALPPGIAEQERDESGSSKESAAGDGAFLSEAWSHQGETPSGASPTGRAPLDYLRAINKVLETVRADQGTSLPDLAAQVHEVWERQARPHGEQGWQIPAPWLGEKRGCLPDWLLKKWVQFTGRSVALRDAPWLDGPVGNTRGIGEGYFEDLARQEGLAIKHDAVQGLLADFGALAGPAFSPQKVDPKIAVFYERTSEFGFDVQAQWGWPFGMAGRLLAMLFTRRLQQMNLPLSPVDTSRGIVSKVFHLLDPRTRGVRHTAWVRRLIGPNNVFLAADYSLTRVPRYPGPAPKVVFPIPNGNMTMILKPQNNPDGSFSLVSSGKGFGDLGFYLTFRDGARVWVRYIRGFEEVFHVFPGAASFLETVHTIRLWKRMLLRLHYRIYPKAGTKPPFGR